MSCGTRRDGATTRSSPPGEPALAGIATLARLDTTVAPAEKYLGPLGAMGVTAYAGLIDAAELRDGDVVWVSAAAGAVGSLAAQIAKLRGHRVIGSAGSEAKVRFLLDELGLDAAFNYHDGPVVDLLREAAPDGIDVYFDNVGGDHLEAALATLRNWGRAALCGAISEYESVGPARGPSNLFQATANNLTLRGFRGSAYQHRLPDVVRELGGWLAEGRLRYPETVIDGLERAPEALMRVLSGDTTGKALVRIDSVVRRSGGLARGAWLPRRLGGERRGIACTRPRPGTAPRRTRGCRRATGSRRAGTSARRSCTSQAARA